MGKPKSVLIQNGNEIIQELCVFNNRSLLEYAIKLGPNHYYMISKKRFDNIITESRANGYDVYDYTTFD